MGQSETVFIDWSVLDDYAEIDPFLSQNLAGATLDSLGRRPAKGSGFPLECLTVAAARCEDGKIPSWR